MRQVLSLPGGSWQQMRGLETIQLPGAVWQTIEHGVVAPANSFVLPAFGATARAKFTSTTPAEWASGISTSVAAITPDVRQTIAGTNPNVAFALDGLETIIRAASGKEPGAAVTMAVFDIVADVLTQIMEGRGVIGSAVSGALDAVAGAAGNVPMIGVVVTVARMIVQAIVSAVVSSGISETERAKLEQAFARYCAETIRPSGLTAPWQLIGTGPSGATTPADMLAQGDARMRLWKWLCGGASRFPSERKEYATWFKSASKQYKIVGFPLHIQRQMVSLMEGIYAARHNPEDAIGSKIGDGGEALFTILAQITLDHSKTAYNLDSLRSLADTFISPGSQVCVKQDAPAAGIECRSFAPCRSIFREVDVGFTLYRFIDGWGEKVRLQKTWDDAGYQVGMKPKTSVLLLDRASTNRYVQSVNNTVNANLAAQQMAAAEQRVAERAEYSRKAAIGTTAVVVGGGAFWLARRLAKKRRGR